jgi:hypothetical protein
MPIMVIPVGYIGWKSNQEEGSGWESVLDNEAKSKYSYTIKKPIDTKDMMDRYFNFDENTLFQLYLFTVYTMTALVAKIAFEYLFKKRKWD